jgi:hypothetical protein
MTKSSLPALPSAKIISWKHLWRVWRSIADKPMPEIVALTLNDADFFYFLEIVQKNPGVEDTRFREYGVGFGNKFVEAFSFKAENIFLIVVRQSASLDICIKHELQHVLTDYKI